MNIFKKLYVFQSINYLMWKIRKIERYGCVLKVMDGGITLYCIFRRRRDRQFFMTKKYITSTTWGSLRCLPSNNSRALFFSINTVKVLVSTFN